MTRKMNGLIHTQTALLLLLLPFAGLGLTLAAGRVEKGSAGEVRGTLTLSTGRHVTGRVRLTKGHELELSDYSAQIKRHFALNEVARIDVAMALEEIIQGWKFNEEG